MHVTVVGTGYVGSVTGACLAYLGHQVTCVDTDQTKISLLQRGESPIYEPNLEEMLRLGAQRSGRRPCIDDANRAIQRKHGTQRIFRA
jgi:UDPglucose 6-dehydrogenase